MIFSKGIIKVMLSIMSITLLCFSTVLAEVFTFEDSWSKHGYTLTRQDAFGVEVSYSLEQMAIEDMVIDGETMQNILISGVFLPNDEGAPNLPGSGRYIALPQGAIAQVTILDYRTETYQGIEVAPAFRIPKEDDDSPLYYRKDPHFYNRNAYYPEKPVKLSEPGRIRGIDVVILGITPFQYNPVTKELVVYRDLKVKIDFIGGNGHFGEDRLRGRHWEPILQGNLLNYASLPKIDFFQRYQTDEDDVEYLIIVPDDPVFIAWADSIKQWRNQQGIITGITTLSEIGGNNATLIENYINNAYFNWFPAPEAVLLLSDYQNSGDLYGITSPMWSGYCVSDNIYADIEWNDDLPDIAIARITAQNQAHLATMITKFLDYERNPPTNPDFYDNPLIAGGWQSDRWFIICCEVIYGYMENVLGKRPVRQYAGASGPPSSWSSNPNTYMIINYFGPGGLGYIPASPSYLTNWSGNAAGINSAINAGAFITQHRDHGMETGWGTPSYTNANLSGLNNDMLTFVFSINCLTGKFNYSGECFAEAFHRMQHGALGVTAATEVSYSFVNDTYVWGMYDSMWPDFDPGYGADPIGSTTLNPCFASAYGKYYLAASNWPYNPSNKDETYHLFHHHGDAFITLYSEMPQNLTVNHAGALLGGMDEFTVTANEGAIIALTVNNEIIGVAEATGAPVNISIPPQTPGNTMLVTVTLQNYYRYMQEVQIVPPEGAYVIVSGCTVEDALGWNPNGQLDYGETTSLSLAMLNIGVEDALDVEVTISCDDLLLTIIDNQASYGTVMAGDTVTVPLGFEVECAEVIEDGYIFSIDVLAVSGADEWESSFALTAHAPVVEYDRVIVSDPQGNNNNWLDPGETADLMVYITNEGSSSANNLEADITTVDPYLTINTTAASYGTVQPGENPYATFNVTAAANTPMEHVAEIDMALEGDMSYTADLQFGVMIGNILNDPSGPDNYGYLAYDPFDLPELPVYEWIEICPDSGGPGSPVPFIIDDQIFQYALPFDFQYYGLTYDSISIATNGWVAPGVVTVEDYSNSGIPNSDGPPRMIAPYWEDLSPQRANSGGVWRWYDETNYCYIVEYTHIEQYSPVGSFETFQVILYDPAHYPTSTNDGRMKFQYKDMSATSNAEGTIGIENHTQTDGIQYFFDGSYDIHAHPIEAGMCILFSTSLEAPELTVTLTPVNPPIVIPAIGGSFEFSVDIENTGTAAAMFDGWIEAVLPDSTVVGPLLLRNNINLAAGATLYRDMTQTVPGIAPTGDYIYRCLVGTYPSTVVDQDSFAFIKEGMEAYSPYPGWELIGWDDELSNSIIFDQYYLAQNSPNPFNPLTTITFGLPKNAEVELRVYNMLGQQVVELAKGWMEAGNHTVTFDASALSSGVYFYSLKADNYSCVMKMLLVK